LFDGILFRILGLFNNLFGSCGVLLFPNDEKDELLSFVDSDVDLIIAIFCFDSFEDMGP
jgi:hypothetical protein